MPAALLVVSGVVKILADMPCSRGKPCAVYDRA